MTDLTRDNLHLSEVYAGGVSSRLADERFAVCKFDDRTFGDQIEDKVRQLIAASRSANTFRAYRADLAHFRANGGAIPADPAMVARYLARVADGLAVATVMRRVAAIGQAHTNRGLPNPCKNDLVRLTLRGIRRTHGRAQWKARPLLKSQLSAIIRESGTTLRDRRDNALLSVGFYGGFRRSELVAIRADSLTWPSDGLSITVPKSKTDQESKGRQVFIEKRSSVCAVEELRGWLEVSNINEGPIFRSVDNHRRIGKAALAPEAVNAALRRRLERAGLVSKDYSGHSLRAGFVTEAVNAGWPLWKIREQTGHASDTTLERYIRHEGLKRELFASI